MSTNETKRVINVMKTNHFATTEEVNNDLIESVFFSDASIKDQRTMFNAINFLEVV